MTGGFHNAQFYLAHREFVTIFDRAVWNRRSRPLAKNYFGAGTRGQLAMPADKISMQVRFYDISYFEFVRYRFVNILIDVALGINDHSFAVRAVQIRSMSKTIEIELLEIHRNL